MFERPEYNWLRSRFGQYDLVYLDPLVCNLRPQNPWLARLRRADQVEQDSAAFLGRLFDVLGLRRGEDNYASFAQAGRVGARLRTDRSIQRRVAQLINDSVSQSPRTRYFQDYTQLCKSGQFGSADRERAASLVLVDGMFTTVARLPKDTRGVPYPSYQQLETSTRTAECLFSTVPGPAVGPRDTMLPLMVDSRLFFDWTADFLRLISAGWHPFARVLGVYNTNPGGHAYLNVVAILLQSFPSLDAVLVPRPGEEARNCLPGMLRYVTRGALQARIDQRQEEVKKLPARPNLTPADQSDDELLWPLCVVQLLCTLNAVTASVLAGREPAAYEALRDYCARLTELGNCLQALEIGSLLKGRTFAPELVLPDSSLFLPVI